MSKEIDQRVVQMEFDNKNFEKGISQSTKSLDNLDKNLNRKRDTTAFAGLEKQLDTITVKFDMMSVAAATAMSRIVNSAMDAGAKMVKALTIENAVTGWDKYAQKTQSVQTIMAATADKFTDTGEQMDFVNEQLQKLMWYADETSYSFTDMTSGVAKFTSNSVDLETSVSAMMGISNWAARSGQNAQSASMAIYNLSQALSTGVVKVIDWRSIELANMATTEFKNTVIETAASVGTLTKNSEGYYQTMKGNIVTTESFRDTLTDEWFTADVLLQTLNKYGDYSKVLYDVTQALDMTASETLDMVSSFKDGTLDIQEYSEKTGMSVKDLTELLTDLSDATFDLGEKSFRAGQETKTFGETIDALKDAASSTWVETYELIFGNYEQAKTFFTDLNNELYGVFVEGSNQRNEMLKQWNELGGRDILIDAFWQAWKNVKDIMRPIQDAFQDVFPPMTATRLYELTQKLGDLVHGFKMSEETALHLKETFKGLFDIFGIVGDVVGAVFKNGFGLLNKAIGATGGSLLSFTATVGRSISGFREWLKTSKLLTGSLEAISTVAQTVIGWFGKIVDTIRNLEIVKEAGSLIEGSFGNVMSKISGYISETFGFLDGFELKLSNLGKISFKNILSNITKFLQEVKQLFSVTDNTIGESAIGAKSILGKLSATISNFASNVSTAFVKMGGVIGNVIKTITKFIENIAQNSGINWGKVLGLVSLTAFGVGVLKIVKILSVFATSLAPLMKAVGVFSKGLAEIPAIVGQSIKKLTKSLNLWIKAQSFKTLADGLKSIAVSVAILTGSLIVLSKIDYDQMKGGLKALAALAGIIAGLSIVTGLVNAFSTKIVGVNEKGRANKIQQASASMIILATAMVVLAKAAREIAKVPEDQLWATVGAVAVLTAVLAGMSILYKKLTMYDKKTLNPQSSAVLIAMAIGVRLMAGTVKTLANLDLDLEKILKIVGGLVVIMGSFWAMSKMLNKFKVNAFNAAGFLLMVFALQRCVKAVEDISKMDLSGFLNFGDFLKKVGAVFTVFTGLVLGGALGSLIAGGHVLKLGIGLLGIVASIRWMVECIKVLNDLPQGNIDDAVEKLSGIVGWFGAFIFLSIFAGKYAARAGVMFLLMSVAIGILTGIIYVVSNLDEDGVERGIKVIRALGTMFGILMVVSNFAGKNYKSILMLTAAVGVMAAAVGLLSFADQKGIQNATLAMSTLMILFSIMELCSAAVKKNTGGMIALAVIVAELGVALYALAKLPVDDVRSVSESFAIVIGAVDTLMLCSMALKKFSAVGLIAFAEAIVMVGVIGHFISEIVSVSKNSADAIIAATAIDMVIIGIIGAMGTMALLGPLGLTALASTAVAIVVLAEIGAVLYAIISLGANADQMMAAAGAIAIALVAFAAAIDILGIGGLGAKATAAIPAMLVMMAVVLELGIVIGLLTMLDTDSVLAVSQALSESLLAFSAALLIVSAAGALGPVAVGVGLAGIALFIGEMTGILYLLGRLSDQAREYITKGAAVLEQLGTAIGNFIGGFIGGILEGITDVLPQVGQNLSDFSTNIQPFIDSAKKIDSSVVTGIGNLVNAIGAITAQGVVDSILKLVGIDVFDKFKQNLVSLGEAIVGFNDATKGITNVDNFSKVATAASDIAIGMESAAKFKVKDFDSEGFKTALENFGGGLKSYAEATAGLDGAAVKRTVEPAKSVIDILDYMPNTGGLWQKITGTPEDIGAFGEKLASFGGSLVAYSETVGTITDYTGVNNSVAATQSIIDVANQLGNEGGLWQKVSGTKEDIDAFGLALFNYGVALVGFSNVVSGKSGFGELDLNALNTVYDKTSGWITLFKGIVEINSATIGPQMAVTEFLSNMSAAVEGLGDLSEDCKDADFSGLDNVAVAMEQISELGTTFYGSASLVVLASDDRDFSNLGDNIKAIVEAAGAASDALADNDVDIDVTKTASIMQGIRMLVAIANTVHADGSKFSSLSDIKFNKRTLKSNIKAIVETISTYSEECNEASEDIDIDSMLKIGTCIQYMAEFANAFLQNEKLEGLMDSELDLETLKSNIETIVDTVKSFGKKCSSAAEKVDEDAIDTVRTGLTRLKFFADLFENHEMFKTFATTDYDLDNLKDNIGDMIGIVKTFCEKCTKAAEKVDTDSIDTVRTGLLRLKGFANLFENNAQLKTFATTDYDLDNLKDNIKDIVDIVKTFCEKCTKTAEKVNEDDIILVKSGLNRLKMFGDVFEGNAQFKTFATTDYDFTNLEDNITDLLTAVKTFGEKATAAAEKINDGHVSKMSSTITNIDSIISSIRDSTNLVIWMTSDKSNLFTNLSTNMQTLCDAIGDFGKRATKNAANVNTTTMSTITSAIPYMEIIANSMQGNQNLHTFATSFSIILFLSWNLAQVANAVGNFGEKATENAEKVNLADMFKISSAVGVMAAVADSVVASAGIQNFISNIHIFALLGLNMNTLADTAGSFGEHATENAAKINTADMYKIGTAVRAMASVAGAYADNSEAFSKANGLFDLAGTALIGLNMNYLADTVGSFGDHVNAAAGKIDYANASTVITGIGRMSTLIEAFESNENVQAYNKKIVLYVLIDSNVSRMVNLIKGFSDKLGELSGVNFNNASIVTDGLDTIQKMADVFNEKSTQHFYNNYISYVFLNSNISRAIELVSKVAGYLDEMGDVDLTRLDLVDRAMDSIASMGEALGSETVKGLINTKYDFTTFGENVSGLTTALKSFGDKLAVVELSKIKTGTEAITAVDTFVSTCNLVKEHAGDGTQLGAVEDLGEALKNFSDTVDIDTAKISTLTRMIDALMKLEGYTGSGVGAFIETLKTLGSTTIPDINLGLSETAPDLYTTIEGIFATCQTHIETGMANIQQYFRDNIPSIGATIRAQRQVMVTAGEYLIGGLMVGLENKRPALMAKARSIATDLNNTIQNALGERSPSVITEEFGEYYDEGLIIGLENKAEEINETAVHIGESMSDSLIDATTESLDERKGEVGEAMVEVLSNMVDAEKEYLKIDEVSNLMRDECGVLIIRGIAEGIEKDMSAEEAAQKKVENIANIFQKVKDQYDLYAVGAEQDYQLWELLNPDADEFTKMEREMESMNKAQSIRAGMVKAAKGEYMAAKAAGLSELEVEKARQKYQKEQIDFLTKQAELNDKIKEYREKAEEASQIPEEILEMSYQERAALTQKELDAIDEVAHMIEFQDEESQKRLEEERQKAWERYGIMKKTVKVPEWMDQMASQTEVLANAIDGTYQMVEILADHPLAEIVAEWTKVPEDLSSYVKIIDEVSTAVNNSSAATNKVYYNSGYQAGDSYGKGVTDGVNASTNNGNPLVDKIISLLPESVQQPAKDAASYIFSAVDREVTDYIPKAVGGWSAEVIDGVVHETPGVIKTFNDRMSVLEEEIMPTGVGVGAALDEGVALGIRQNEIEPIRAAQQMALNTLGAAMDALEIHSPSRKAGEKVGDPFVEGIAQHILTNDSAENAARATASSMIAAMQQELDRSKLTASGDVSFTFNDEHSVDEYTKVIRKQQTKLGQLIDQYNDTVSRLGANSAEAADLYDTIQTESSTLMSLTRDLNNVRNELLSGAASSDLYVRAQEIVSRPSVTIDALLKFTPDNSPGLSENPLIRFTILETLESIRT